MFLRARSRVCLRPVRCPHPRQREDACKIHNSRPPSLRLLLGGSNGHYLVAFHCRESTRMMCPAGALPRIWTCYGPISIKVQTTTKLQVKNGRLAIIMTVPQFCLPFKCHLPPCSSGHLQAAVVLQPPFLHPPPPQVNSQPPALHPLPSSVSLQPPILQLPPSQVSLQPLQVFANSLMYINISSCRWQVLKARTTYASTAANVAKARER